MIQKLIRQFGEHGNDYSPLEMGDKINEIIDSLNQKPTQFAIDPAKVVSTGAQSSPEKQSEVPPIRAFAVRAPASGDKVYMVKDGKKYWIKNPETLKKLGFSFHSVKDMKNEEFGKIPTGEPIDMKEKTKLPVAKPQGQTDKYDL